MVTGAAGIAAGAIGGPGGAVVGLIGGFVGGYIDREIGIFGSKTKSPDFNGVQPEGLAPGTPFLYCIGHANRVAGQRLWTGDLIRERPSQPPTTKRGNTVPEIIRGDWASAIVAHQIHAIEKAWWDGEKVFDDDPIQGDVNASVDQLITVDWWSAFRRPSGTAPIIQWHLIIETIADSNGRAVPGAPDLSRYTSGDRVNLTLTDPTHGTQVSRKNGSATQTPWLVVSSEELPKGNSRLVVDLLFDASRPATDFGWWNTFSAGPPLARPAGPFTYPVSPSSNLRVQHTSATQWKGGIWRASAGPGSDFEFHAGSIDQDQLAVMRASIGDDVGHFPGIACVGVSGANVENFGSRFPNCEWLVSSHDHEIYTGEAVDRIMGDRLGFRGNGQPDQEFDTTVLFNTPGAPAQLVAGYQWAAGDTGMDIMLPIIAVHGLFVRERWGSAIFQWRRARSVVQVDPADLDARPFGDRPGELIEMEPAEDRSAPDIVDVHFADVDNDNQRQTATAMRQGFSRTSDPVRQDVNLERYAMTFEQATGIAQDVLRDANERKLGARKRLPLTYDHIEAGDVIEMSGEDAPGGGPWFLLVDRIQRGDLLEVESFVLSLPPSIKLATGSNFASDPPRPQTSPPMAIEVLDLGPLRDEHATTPGYYVAASHFAPTGKVFAGSIWRTKPGESGPSQVSPIKHATVMGYTVDLEVLGDAATDVIDEANTIDVDVFDGDLSSVTEAELLGGANRCVIGGEVLAFRDAVALETGPRRFRLSGLLRGLRGTDAAVSEHQSGERFVLLGHDSAVLPLTFVPAQVGEIGSQHEVQAVHVGGSTDTVAAYPHTVEASTARPLPPYGVSAEKRPNGDVVFSWFRRTRIAWDSLDEPPLLASAERYTIVIDGGARTFEVEGDPQAVVTEASRTYTAAMQAEDAPGLTITAEIRQVDPIYGASQPATHVVT